MCICSSKLLIYPYPPFPFVLGHSVVSDSLWPHGLWPIRLFCPWILQTRILRGLSVPSPGDLLDPMMEPRSHAFQGDSLPSEPPGKPWLVTINLFSMSVNLFLALWISLVVSCFQTPHAGDSLWYLSLSVWLFSLGVIISRSIYKVSFLGHCLWSFSANLWLRGKLELRNLPEVTVGLQGHKHLKHISNATDV